MAIYKSFVYRIYPNKEQAQKIDFNINSSRYVYNYYLAKRDKAYEENGELMNYYKCDSHLSNYLKKEQPWLNEADSHALSSSIKNLDNAFNRFFKKLSRHPVYKKKKDQVTKDRRSRIKLSYRTRGCSYVCDDMKHIRLTKLGVVKARGYKSIPKDSIVKNITITKKPNGKYFASVQFKIPDHVADEITPKSTGKIVGIDVGIRNLVTTSDGKEFVNPRFLEKSKHKIERLKKALRRKPSPSNNREKICAKLSTVHQHVINQRRDYINKIVHYLITNYDVIMMEDLKIMDLVNQRKRFKKIANSTQHFINEGIFDSGIQHLMQDLFDRSEWFENKMCIKIPRTYPSTKTCNTCGYIKPKMKISKPTWVCPICHTKHNRDINAAKNIKDEGIRISAKKLVDFTK